MKRAHSFTEEDGQSFENVGVFTVAVVFLAALFERVVEKLFPRRT